MLQPNYDQFDAQYRSLRKDGFHGWGGANFERRMRDWEMTLDSFMRAESFPKKGSKILELGSGAGDGLIALAEKGYQVTGIEISSTAVEWAQEKLLLKQLASKVVHGNIAKPLPFADASFDAVLDANCLHCLTGTDRANALNEVQRVLRRDGFLLVSHMVNDPRELPVDVIFDPELRVQKRGSVLYRSMPTYGRLVEEVGATGFDAIKQSLHRNPWWDHAELWCIKR
ncbi:MAG: class I SAM-dependent methyltransferase [Bdellovibrionota bacterium]